MNSEGTTLLKEALLNQKDPSTLFNDLLSEDYNENAELLTHQALEHSFGAEVFSFHIWRNLLPCYFSNSFSNSQIFFLFLLARTGSHH
jgi:hypothetical protein